MSFKCPYTPRRSSSVIKGYWEVKAAGEPAGWYQPQLKCTRVQGESLRNYLLGVSREYGNIIPV